MSRDKALDTHIMEQFVNDGILNWIGDNAEKFGLLGWTFCLHYHFLSDDSEATAQVQPVESTPYCHVWISREFINKTPEEQRLVLVHEMLHPLLGHLSDTIRVDLRKHLSPMAHDILWDGYKRNLELMVETMARGLAPLFPFIEWPEVAHADDESGAEGPHRDDEEVRQEEGRTDLLQQGEQRWQVRQSNGQGSPQSS